MAAPSTPWRPPYVFNPKLFKCESGSPVLREKSLSSAVNDSECESGKSGDEGNDPLITMLDFSRDQRGDNVNSTLLTDQDKSCLSAQVAMQVSTRILLGAINPVIENGDFTAWDVLFPEVPFEDFCANLNDFFSRNIPSVFRHSSDYSGGLISTSGCSIRDRAGDMTKTRTRKNAQQNRRADQHDTTLEEYQVTVQGYTEELVKLEQQLLVYVDNPTETVKLQIKIKHLERQLFDAKSALNVASTRGEFRQEVRELQGEIEGVRSRQDEVEQRVSDGEVKINSELVGVKERLARIEEENRARKLENDALIRQIEEESRARELENGALKKMVVEHGEAHHRLQKTVNIVDNKQRIQNLRLHGLKTDQVDDELRRILPTELYNHVDIAYAAGQDPGNHKPVLVRFKTVSACEAALQLVRSDDFKDNFPHVRPAHDASDLLRVGQSRIRAAEDELRRTYEGIIFLRDGVRYNGVKYHASDFAASHVVIAGQPFNVGAAVQANRDYENADSVSAYIRGQRVSGVRLIRGRHNTRTAGVIRPHQGGRVNSSTR